MTLKEKMLRYKVMEFHQELTQEGQYLAAWKVLGLLRKGYIYLDFSDVDWMLEEKLGKLGCRIRYDNRWFQGRACMKPEQGR